MAPRKVTEIKKNNGPWKKEEDDLLKAAVERQNTQPINWTHVAQSFGGTRSKSQLYSRWKYSIQPRLRKGRFTPTEDKLIYLGSIKFDEDFKKISTLLTGRSSAQVKSRYQYLSALNQPGGWTQEDDELLLQGVKRYGNSWSTIVRKHLPNRQRAACYYRYLRLKNYMKVNEELPEEEQLQVPRYNRKRTALTFQEMERLLFKDTSILAQKKGKKSSLKADSRVSTMLHDLQKQNQKEAKLIRNVKKTLGRPPKKLPEEKAVSESLTKKPQNPGRRRTHSSEEIENGSSGLQSSSIKDSHKAHPAEDVDSSDPQQHTAPAEGTNVRGEKLGRTGKRLFSAKKKKTGLAVKRFMKLKWQKIKQQATAIEDDV